MGVTNYYTVDGQMIGYKDANGRKDFLTDNLGSVTAEIDQSGTNRTFDGRYRPYGNSLWSTGTRGAFGWVGTWGYRGTGLSTSTHYMRARHYSQVSGRWSSVDPSWPSEPGLVYVNVNPSTHVDPSGLDGGRPVYACSVKICNLNGFGLSIPTHQYMCATDENSRKCSGGLGPGKHGGTGEDTDQDRPCQSGSVPRPGGGPPVTVSCTEVSTNCNLVHAVCGCLDSLRKKHRPFGGCSSSSPYCCINYSIDVRQCACDALHLSGSAKFYCEQNFVMGIPVSLSGL